MSSIDCAKDPIDDAADKEPIAEMSRPRLIEIIQHLSRQNEGLREELARADVRRVADAAAIGRERLRPWWSRIWR